MKDTQNIIEAQLGELDWNLWQQFSLLSYLQYLYLIGSIARLNISLTNYYDRLFATKYLCPLSLHINFCNWIKMSQTEITNRHHILYIFMRISFYFIYFIIYLVYFSFYHYWKIKLNEGNLHMLFSLHLIFLISSINCHRINRILYRE